MSASHLKRLTTFKNKGLINSIDMNDIYYNHEKIYKHIQEYENKSTANSYLQSLIDAMKRATVDDDTRKQTIINYAQKAYDLSRMISESYKDNKPLKTRIKLNTDYDYDKLYRIMEKLSEKFEDHKETPKEHKILLVLKLNLLTPPLRSEISNMRVGTSSQTIAEPHQQENYIVKDDAKYNYVIKNYKTKTRYGDRIIPISDTLTEFLDASLGRYPRAFLLCGDNPDEPLRYGRYITLLYSYFGRGFGCDLFRSIYITHALNKNISYLERETLAKKMLHSVNSQMLFYNKVGK